MKILHIKSKLRTYNVYFKKDIRFIEDLGNNKRCLFVVDRNVYNLYKEDMEKYIRNNALFILDANEENKTLDYAVNLYDYLINMEAKKNTTIVSIGGGITQDVSGYVASTMYRGIEWIYVPTTLLSQTDSCIGSKTSLNYKKYKNIVGTFYPPNEIYICPMFIETLSKKDFYSGLGESIKLQLMKSNAHDTIKEIAMAINKCKNDYQFLMKLVEENLEIKIDYIENDEFDKGKRNLLNYGHCFGHALETSSMYKIPHGIAVTIGIIFANAISLLRGKLSENKFNDINNLLLLKNIYMEIKEEYFEIDKIVEAMKNDKKREGIDLTIIIPEKNMSLIKISNLKYDEFLKGLNITKKMIMSYSKQGFDIDMSHLKS